MTELKESVDKKAAQAGLMQLVVFKLGQEEYAMHIDQIKEVVITPNITRMPQTPGFMKGVANIRGNIIAIIDLEEKFGLSKNNEEASKSKSNYSLVVESEEYKVGILVKEVPNTLSIQRSELDTSSGFLQQTSFDGHYIMGIVKSNERMIIMLDMIRLIGSEAIQHVTKQIQ